MAKKTAGKNKVTWKIMALSGRVIESGKAFNNSPALRALLRRVGFVPNEGSIYKIQFGKRLLCLFGREFKNPRLGVLSSVDDVAVPLGPMKKFIGIDFGSSVGEAVGTFLKDGVAHAFGTMDVSYLKYADETSLGVQSGFVPENKWLYDRFMEGYFLKVTGTGRSVHDLRHVESDARVVLLRDIENARLYKESKAYFGKCWQESMWKTIDEARARRDANPRLGDVLGGSFTIVKLDRKSDGQCFVSLQVKQSNCHVRVVLEGDTFAEKMLLTHPRTGGLVRFIPKSLTINGASDYATFDGEIV